MPHCITTVVFAHFQLPAIVHFIISWQLRMRKYNSNFSIVLLLYQLMFDCQLINYK